MRRGAGEERSPTCRRPASSDGITFSTLRIFTAAVSGWSPHGPHLSVLCQLCSLSACRSNDAHFAHCGAALVWRSRLGVAASLAEGRRLSRPDSAAAVDCAHRCRAAGACALLFQQRLCLSLACGVHLNPFLACDPLFFPSFDQIRQRLMDDDDDHVAEAPAPAASSASASAAGGAGAAATSASAATAAAAAKPGARSSSLTAADDDDDDFPVTDDAAASNSQSADSFGANRIVRDMIVHQWLHQLPAHH
jgi:hypothetical protein